MRYAQKQGKRGFFTYMTTVLPSSCLVRDHPGSLQVAGARWRDRIPGETPQNRQDRGIIPDGTDLMVFNQPFGGSQHGRQRVRLPGSVG